MAWPTCNRPLEDDLPASPTVGCAVLTSNCRSCTLVRLPPDAASSRAAAPEAKGVETEVPLQEAYCPPGMVLRTSTPGADSWTASTQNQGAR